MGNDDLKGAGEGTVRTDNDDSARKKRRFTPEKRRKRNEGRKEGANVERTREDLIQLRPDLCSGRERE